VEREARLWEGATLAVAHWHRCRTGLFNSAEPRKEKRKEKDHPLLE
jgi:hypothetical protein